MNKKTASVALSVNLNKIALIRNSRPGNNPDIVDYAKKILAAGADGLTVHPSQTNDIFAQKIAIS